ncbi:hypothetical protein C8T65DRAFT_743317 [Cerioporus squamosus]|nr:hypothetical protein C8T65DRAFT_743317 [Cerioporus squamosus]
MSASLRYMLPVELLTLITSLARRKDLAALASTSKRMNLIATPYLYTELDLFTYRSALSCLTTLASPPATLTFPERDLAAGVHSFRLRVTCFQYNPVMMDDFELLGRLLSVIVPRMVNLRVLDCGPRGLRAASQVLAALIGSPHPKLESMQLCLFAPSRPAQAEGAPSAHVPYAHQSPRLHTITVFALSQPSIEDLLHLKMLIRSSADHLRRMTLATSSTTDTLLIFPQFTLPVLEHLEIMDRDLYDPGWATLTSLRSLAVRTATQTLEEPLPLLPAAFPALEELACTHSQVPLFLSPPDIGPPRPIHTIALDYTRYERNGGETTEAIPRWKHVLFAFEHFQFSAVPIRDIRFYVNRLLAPELEAAVSELRSLERLTMVVWHEPKRDALFALGECVFARLPRLHTFLLGDVVKKQYDHRDHFWFARDVTMQRALLAQFEKHTSALRRVAFTTEFEWEKGEDGRWYTTEVVDPEVREEPEDSGDETESDADSDWDMDSDSD